MELNDKKKTLLLILAVFIVFGVVSAETLIAAEHDHDCIGENCPICLQIEVAKCFLRAFNLAGFIAFFIIFHAFFIQAHRIYYKLLYYFLTPIKLKVRFNS